MSLSQAETVDSSDTCKDRKYFLKGYRALSALDCLFEGGEILA